MSPFLSHKGRLMKSAQRATVAVHRDSLHASMMNIPQLIAIQHILFPALPSSRRGAASREIRRRIRAVERNHDRD